MTDKKELQSWYEMRFWALQGKKGKYFGEIFMEIPSCIFVDKTWVWKALIAPLTSDNCTTPGVNF